MKALHVTYQTMLGIGGEPPLIDMQMVRRLPLDPSGPYYIGLGGSPERGYKGPGWYLWTADYSRCFGPYSTPETTNSARYDRDHG